MLAVRCFAPAAESLTRNSIGCRFASLPQGKVKPFWAAGNLATNSANYNYCVLLNGSQPCHRRSTAEVVCFSLTRRCSRLESLTRLCPTSIEPQKGPFKEESSPQRTPCQVSWYVWRSVAELFKGPPSSRPQLRYPLASDES